MKQKTFKTSVLLTVASAGIALGDPFHDVHEAVEHLLGGAVLTHMLAQESIWRSAADELVRQHPAFAPYSKQAVAEAVAEWGTPVCVDKFHQWLKAAVTELGTEFTCDKGGDTLRSSAS